MTNEHQKSSGGSTAFQIIVRFIVAAIILSITAFFTPGFSIDGLWSLVLASIVLTIIDYLIVTFTGVQTRPFGKGLIGFILAVILLYITQFFVSGYSISWLAAIIGALIYGIVDSFIPGSYTIE